MPTDPDNLKGVVLTIYGSNTDLTLNSQSLKFAKKADVLALSDVKTMVIETTGAYATPVADVEKISFWDKSELHKVKARFGYNPELLPKAFPNSNIAFEDYFDTDALNKTYKWIDLTNYQIKPRRIIQDPTLLMSINISGYSCESESDDNGGYKKIKLNIIERGNV